MFIPDTPIEGNEQDKLGRSSFAKKLGDTVRDWDREESIVIALFGPWGSGKTSILYMSIEHILETTKDRAAANKPIIVRFNPWNFSEQDQLLKAFFQQLYSELSKITPDKGRELREKLEKFTTVLGLLEAVPKVGDIAGSVSKFIGIFSPPETLEDLKEGLKKYFRELGHRIVIIIDDIDRLTDQEIRQLFQLIKLNADFPNTIYIAAFSRDVVEKALNIEGEATTGRQYLEKIVQVGFDVPPIDPAFIDEFLGEQLDIVLADTPSEKWDAVRWGNLYHSGFRLLFSNLRDVKRFMNSLTFNYQIVADEVNSIDFIGLEAIRIFIPEVYRELSKNKDLFTTTGLVFRGGMNQQDLKSQFQQVFSMSKDKSHIAETICRQLFPQLKAAYENVHYRAEYHPIWRKDRRICSQDIFDMYFLLGTPKGEISQRELDVVTKVAEEPDKLLEIFRKMEDEGRIVRLLDMLDAVFDNLTDVGSKGLIQALLIFGDELPDQRRGVLDWGTDLQISRLIFRSLLMIQDEKERCNWFIDQINKSSAISTPIKQVSLDEPSEEKPRENPLFSEECLLKLRETCVQKISQFAKLGQLQNAKGLASILFRWRKWSTDPVLIENYIAELTGNREGALDFLAGFLQNIYSQRVGDLVSKSNWAINLNDVDELVKVSKLDELLSGYTTKEIGELSERRKLALETFRKVQKEQAETIENHGGLIPFK